MLLGYAMPLNVCLSQFDFILFYPEKEMTSTQLKPPCLLHDTSTG